MKKKIVTQSFYYVKMRDKIGGILRTEVFRQDNGVFKAFSFYLQDIDEKIVGYGESDDENIAIRFSRKDLRSLWKREIITPI